MPNYQYRPIINGLPAAEVLAGVEKRDGELIIVGDHPNACEELLQVGMKISSHIMCINNSWRRVKHLGNPAYVATLHAHECGFHPSFPSENVPVYAEVWGLWCGGVESKRVDKLLDFEPRGGTSTLFGVIVGLYLGYRQITVVGCHLGEPPYNDPEHLAGWTKYWHPHFAGKVRVPYGRLAKIYP